jgi:AAA15 family ATPase/GTPase
MANVVLKSLRVKNFGPFADEIYFTTEIDKSKKEYPENTFQINNTYFNSVSYIFGANGAGKSNFCKATRQ